MNGFSLTHQLPIKSRAGVVPQEVLLVMIHQLDDVSAVGLTSMCLPSFRAAVVRTGSCKSDMSSMGPHMRTEAIRTYLHSLLSRQRAHCGPVQASGPHSPVRNEAAHQRTRPVASAAISAQTHAPCFVDYRALSAAWREKPHNCALPHGPALGDWHTRCLEDDTRAQDPLLDPAELLLVGRSSAVAGSVPSARDSIRFDAHNPVQVGAFLSAIINSSRLYRNA